jgi:hypothetical protein
MTVKGVVHKFIGDSLFKATYFFLFLIIYEKFIKRECFISIGKLNLKYCKLKKINIII